MARETYEFTLEMDRHGPFRMVYKAKSCMLYCGAVAPAYES